MKRLEGTPGKKLCFAITSSYGCGGIAPMNFLSSGHYPKQGVIEIYESE